jgi:hypothetical protein
MVQAGHTNIKLRRSLPPLIVALVPGQQRSLDKLKAMRIDLSNQVASLINDFGPKLYDDFNEVRCFHGSLWISSNFPSLKSQESSCHPLVLLRQVGRLACGEGRAVPAPWMRKDWDLRIL